MSVAAVPAWDSLFKLDQYCINEVEFWNDNIIKGNIRYCFGGITRTVLSILTPAELVVVLT